MVPFIEQAPTGWDFTGKDWAGALKLDNFVKPGAFRVMGRSFSSDSEIKTEVYLLRTRGALHLGVICFDSDGISRKGDPVGGEPEQTERALPKGNRFEVYLDGDLADRQAYYQVIINASGRLWLSKAGEEVASHGVVGKVESGEKAWKIHIEIPLNEIGIAADVTEPIHVNFFRDYHPSKDGEERQFSTWNGVSIASFHTLQPLILFSLQEP